MEKNEFFEVIRDAMLDGIDAMKTGRPLVTRQVCRRRTKDKQPSGEGPPSSEDKSKA